MLTLTSVGAPVKKKDKFIVPSAKKLSKFFTYANQPTMPRQSARTFSSGGFGQTQI